MKTIVVGVDFSAQTEGACAQALAIARHAGARIVLAHATALPDAPEGLPPSMASTAEAYLRILRGRAAGAQRELADLGERLGGQGAEISQVLLDGHADDALVTASAELDADLIVVGSRRRRGVATRVVRAAGCPVLVARGVPGGYRKVCIATDFSAAAARALELARVVAVPEAELHLIHFWSVPPIPRAHATGEVDATVAEVRDGLARHGAALGAEAAATDPRLRFHLREGDAADGIVTFAVESGCDLVVVGSHGRRGLRRLLLGSVAEATVRDAPCSVLVTR